MNFRIEKTRMKSELFNNKFAFIGNSYPDLVSRIKGKLFHEPFGDIDDPFSSGPDMKTANSPLFHLYEIRQILIRYVNFIRNHKINITSFSYSFIRKVMKWRMR